MPSAAPKSVRPIDNAYPKIADRKASVNDVNKPYDYARQKDLFKPRPQSNYAQGRQPAQSARSPPRTANTSSDIPK